MWETGELLLAGLSLRFSRRLFRLFLRGFGLRDRSRRFIGRRLNGLIKSRHDGPPYTG
ncbi:TilS substrate-binding domain-containing protein [Faecalibaculum rodentium]|uniref:TilS substrate-binding domain-containing protein n=1 Tax=Faecalibaculum rodentium TaxID=1702221 RepID=UPI003F732852